MEGREGKGERTRGSSVIRKGSDYFVYITCKAAMYTNFKPKLPIMRKITIETADDKLSMHIPKANAFNFELVHRSEGPERGKVVMIL